jgi:hypothetical protein
MVVLNPEILVGGLYLVQHDLKFPDNHHVTVNADEIVG